MPGTLNQRIMVVAGALTLFLTMAVLYRFDPAQNWFFPHCQFHAMTGMQCPGCGGLRAAHVLLHGRVAEAWRLNALFVAGLPAALAFAGWRWFERRRGPGTFRKLPLAWVWIFVTVVIAFGVLRNLPGGVFAWATP